VVDEALHFYAINATTAQGYLAFTTTFEEMRAASQEAVSSGAHVLIREQFNVALYALSSGECQVNGFYSDGNLYEFIFPCP
jgi:predicted RecA/RadA family phage recombinase